MGLIDTTQPKFRVTANGGDITAKISERLISLRLTDEAGFQSDTLEIALADHDPQNPVAMPPTGAELEVFLGYDTAAVRMGLFIADEIELAGWPGEMIIRARAAVYNESKRGKTDLQTQKSRSWAAGTKLGDMAAKIAKEHGMEAAVAASLKSITLPHFDQTEESDISFLARIAKRYDAIAKPSGGKIVLAKLGESKTTSGSALPTIAVDASQVSSFRMTRATRETPGTVVAYWHNKGTAKKVEVTVGSGEPVKRLRHHYPNADAAGKAAKAELDARTRAKNTLSLTMPGDPSVAAECRLMLAGFRDGVNGEWLITRAQHDLDGSGYRTSIEAEKPQVASSAAAV